VLTALRLAAYQLIFLDRVPERAAVHESVELIKVARKRSAASFANAVLREFARSPVRPPAVPTSAEGDAASGLAAALAHPEWLVTRWVERFGRSVAEQVCRHNQKIPETCISIRNRASEEQLKNDGIDLASGRLLASARRVVAGDLSRARLFREGQIAVQDEASQLVALLVGKGSNILDCCAAPGGKARMLSERNPEASIVAVDLHPHRARLLRKLIAATNVHVIAADACNLPTAAVFDRVVADVPCSGTGTLARNPEIKWRLNLTDLQDLQVRQISILRSAMQRVAPGGRLVYSTCSLEREENEEVVQAVVTDGGFRTVSCGQVLDELRAEGELVWTDPASLVDGNYLRTIPGVHPCDGFFAAVIERV